MKATKEKNDILTEPEAAEYLKVSRSSLRKNRMHGLPAHGISPPYIRIGRSIRYIRQDLDRWLEKFKHVGKV